MTACESNYRLGLTLLQLFSNNRNLVTTTTSFMRRARYPRQLAPVFSAAPFFCRHPSVQNILLSHKVRWSAVFLVPSASYMEPTPRFYPSRIHCQFFFFQTFIENLSFPKLFLQSHRSECLRVCLGVCA